MNKIIKTISKNNIIVGIVFLLFLHMLIMLFRDCAPFGDNLYVAGDNLNQLTAYIEELKRKLSENESLFYTFRVTGGGSFYYIFSYTLCSLFMLPLILTPVKYFSTTLNLSFVAISILMFLSMRAYLTARESKAKLDKDSILILPFSLTYALLPALINAATFYPYLGSFTLMPLALLGLEKFVAKKGWVLYAVSLSLTVMSNFYIGFICCIFIVLYYLTLDFDNIKHFLDRSIKVLLLSILSVAISSFIIFPVVASLANGGYGVSEYKGFAIFENLLYLVKQAFIGAKPVLVGSSANAYYECNTYIGVLAMLLTVLYFFEKKIKLNVRLRKLVVLILLLLSLDESRLNYIMHLFHYTVGIPNRQTVLVMLYMIILAEEGLYHFINSKLSKRRFIKLAASAILILIAYLSAIVVYRHEKGIIVFGIITLIAVILYALVLVYLKVKTKNELMLFIISLVMIVEMSFSYALTNSHMPTKADNVLANYNKLSKIVASFEENEFYNTTYNDLSCTANLGLLYGYNTINGYSTNIREGYVHALGELGVNVSTNIREQGVNSFLSSILARKYLIEPLGDEYRFSSRDKNYMTYNKIVSYDNLDLYENANYLSPVIVANSDFDDLEKLLLNNSENANDIVKANNLLCEALSGTADLIKKADISDYNIEEVDNCTAEFYEGYLVFSPETENGNYNPNKDSNVSISFTAPESGEYIVDATNNSVLGCYEKGEKVTFNAGIGAKDYNPETGVYATDIVVNILDKDKFIDAYKVMKNNQMTINAYKSDEIKGVINATKDSKVFTAIPYDSSWKVYLDQKELKTTSIAGAFLTFDLTAGEHKIVLKYYPKGLNVGIIISVISFVIIMIIYGFRRKKSRTNDCE
ncbi:MAG: YfhO family protein [Lachnospiraceae bacterium]|nr:YfhO family protein [Lachnospiraceae bacterium]